jgi:hypothetical protein
MRFTLGDFQTMVLAVALFMWAHIFLPIDDASATSQGNLPDRESDGDLEDVGLNAEVFSTGDNITISGLIDDPVQGAPISIRVIDPEGQEVAVDIPTLTADDTFTYTFEAGKGSPVPALIAPMTVGGNYRVEVTYIDGLDINQVDLEFKYIVTSASGQQQPQSQTTTGDARAPNDRDGKSFQEELEDDAEDQIEDLHDDFEDLQDDLEDDLDKLT